MYKIPRYSISLVRERGPLYADLRKATDSRSAADILRPLFDSLDREQFIVLCLDAKTQPIGVNIVSIGTLTLSIVHPREVFKSAILLNAAGIIVAHNHPSGDITPSKEDDTLTARLKQASDIMGIRFLDHLVLGETPNGKPLHFSYADEGRL